MNIKARTIPFKVEHLELMEIREHELNSIFQMSNIEAGLKVFEMRKTAVTLLYDGVILGILGFFEMWPGVCEVFVIPSNNLRKHHIVFARIVKKYLNNLIEDYKFHRVQVTALDDKLHNTWLEFLGFVPEGIMRKYNINKKDYRIWARVN